MHGVGVDGAAALVKVDHVTIEDSEGTPSAFVTNTTFSNIFGHGITQGYEVTFVDFAHRIPSKV